MYTARHVLFAHTTCISDCGVQARSHLIVTRPPGSIEIRLIYQILLPRRHTRMCIFVVNATLLPCESNCKQALELARLAKSAHNWMLAVARDGRSNNVLRSTTLSMWADLDLCREPLFEAKGCCCS